MKIQTGEPDQTGLYLVWTEPDKFSFDLSYAKRTLLSWSERYSEWRYPSIGRRFESKVYQWFGPIEPLRIEL